MLTGETGVVRRIGIIKKTYLTVRKNNKRPRSLRALPYTRRNCKRNSISTIVMAIALAAEGVMRRCVARPERLSSKLLVPLRCRSRRFAERANFNIKPYSTVLA